MKQLIMLFAISILTMAIFACGPAVGRAVGDAEVDVDATLAEMEPQTESEQELYDMLKEIDRLHKEERAELLAALSNSSEVIDELLVLIGHDVDLDGNSLSAGSLIDGGAGDADLSDLIDRAKSTRDREEEIQTALENAEKVPWDRIKFLNEQLELANAKLGALNEDLSEATKELDHADQLEARLVVGLKGQDSEYTALARRAEEASEKIEVIGHILQVAFDGEGEEESATEKLIRLNGREIIAAHLEDCMNDSQSSNSRVAREDCADEAIVYHQEMRAVEPTDVDDINNAAMLSDPDTEDAVYGVIECLEDLENMVFTMDMVEDPVTGDFIGRAELYQRNCYRNVNENIVPSADGNSPDGRAAISSSDDAATSLKRKLDSEDRETRAIRKAIRTGLDDISDKQFKSNVEDLLYDKSLTGEGVETLMGNILNLAHDDLECDPHGIKGEPCDYDDEYYEDDLEDITGNTAMRLHEEICELDGIKDDCWESLEDPIWSIVNQAAESLYSTPTALGSDEAYAKLNDISDVISSGLLSYPDLALQFANVDGDALNGVIQNASAGLVGGITQGDDWGMAQAVSSDFEDCIKNLESKGAELGDAAAECLGYTSSAFSAEFNLGKKGN